MDMEDDDENDSALMAPAAQQVTKIQDTTQPTNIRTDYIPKGIFCHMMISYRLYIPTVL